MDTDNIELGGLDEDEIFIHIQINNGNIFKFKKEQLKYIDLIQSILKSDTNAGITESDAIILPILKKEIFELIEMYINKHGENDYEAKNNSIDPELLYSERMNLWDRNFINEIVIKDKKDNTNLLFKLLDASAYLMYTTLHSKICCYLANSETNEDYRNIFRELRLIGRNIE